MVFFGFTPATWATYNPVFCSILYASKKHTKRELRLMAQKSGDQISHYEKGFFHPRWLAGFLPSTEYCTQLIIIVIL